VIGTSGDRKSKTLPLINADDRIEKGTNSPLINTDDSDRTKANPINHKGDPFDSQSSLRAGSGTQREFLSTVMQARLRK